MSAPTVRVGRKRYPVTMSTAQAGEWLELGAEATRLRCVAGQLPTLGNGRGARGWRIITTKFFDLLGIAYTVEGSS